MRLHAFNGSKSFCVVGRKCIRIHYNMAKLWEKMKFVFFRDTVYLECIRTVDLKINFYIKLTVSKIVNLQVHTVCFMRVIIDSIVQ